MIFLLAHSRSLFYLMYLISWNKVCQVISCILSAYYLSLLTRDVVLQTLLHIMFDGILKVLILDFRDLCLNSKLSRRSCIIVRTGHIITGLSGLSPFDEFMRIQVSNMETLFKMDFYFPGLRFTMVVDRCFCFYGCISSLHFSITGCKLKIWEYIYLEFPVFLLGTI